MRSLWFPKLGLICFITWNIWFATQDNWKKVEFSPDSRTLKRSFVFFTLEFLVIFLPLCDHSSPVAPTPPVSCNLRTKCPSRQQHRDRTAGRSICSQISVSRLFPLLKVTDETTWVRPKNTLTNPTPETSPTGVDLLWKSFHWGWFHVPPRHFPSLQPKRHLTDQWCHSRPTTSGTTSLWMNDHWK